jgi:hypothetical protein
LLSVVAQTFAFAVFCAGEDVPPSSGDADEGCQWEVHTDEIWVPYWDSQVLVVQLSSLPSRAKGGHLMREMNHFHKTLLYLLKHSFGFKLV